MHAVYAYFVCFSLPDHTAYTYFISFIILMSSLSQLLQNLPLCSYYEIFKFPRKPVIKVRFHIKAVKNFKSLKPQACNFIKKETLAQVLSCDFCHISKNTFSTEHLWATASRNKEIRSQESIRLSETY